MGKTKLFTDKNAAKLLDLGMRYFKSISKTVATGEYNDLGEVMHEVKWLKIPLLYELADYIGVDEDTFRRYCADNSAPTLKKNCRYLRNVCESYWIYEGKDGNAQFASFMLQAFHDRSTKNELEIGKETREAAKEATMTIAEKMEILREAAKDVGDGGY